ncbi:MAG: DUF1643 domain-containing protein [Leptolyngbya sp. LCM1.Bin17]|nr:MAG: DUF1643 domain-containing protein [Leptolyngbya sp. LCM1.Bin17]
MERSARFDPSGSYRYRLTRQWQPSCPWLTIIMLNPSQADATVDDPTLRRCQGLAQSWGFGAIDVVNLFAYRTAHPRRLKQASDPVGPDNDAVLLTAAAQANQILLAWGNWGCLYHRDRAVLALLAPYQDKWTCLGRNRTGQPRHPLYVPRQRTLQPWT